MQVASLRNVAKSVYPFKAKLAKLDEQIKAIEEEKSMIEDTINSFETGAKRITGGYTSEDILERVEVKTGKLDAKGKEIITVRYDLRYPETGFPPAPSPVETKVIGTVPAGEDICVDYAPEHGADFDIDKEKAESESNLPDDFFAQSEIQQTSLS